MKQGDPTITAPISRTRKRRGRHTLRDNSQVVIVCAMSIFTCVSTVLVARSLLISSSTSSSVVVENYRHPDLAGTTRGDGGVVAIIGGDRGSGGGGGSSSSEKRGVGLSSRSLRRTNHNLVHREEEEEEEEEEDGAAKVVVGDNMSSSSFPSSPLPHGILIHTSMGDVYIHLTPETSGESSVRYIADVASPSSSSSSSCERCKFYRAEPDLLLQGVMARHPSSSSGEENGAGAVHVLKGPCPIANYVPKTPCPTHDPDCGCHGPLMARGMVGWAGGGSGPDFFVNTHATPVDWWENQHTVWGIIRDEESLKVVESMYHLPAHDSGMRMLDEEIPFTLKLAY